MSVGVWYWLFVILALVFGGWQTYSGDTRWRWGGNLIIFILFALLGVHLFGWPIKP